MASSPRSAGYNISSAEVAIVTGGGSGIGRAICVSLAKKGVKHIAAADVNLQGAEETARQVEALGCKGYAVKADIATQKGVDSLVDEVERKAGAKIDMFFANAGIAGDTGLEEATQVMEKMMAVNVYQSIYAAKKLLPDLAERGGAFVITASAAGLLMQLGSLAYTVSKHAARTVGEWLSVTYGDAGLHVVCLCPMLVQTPLSPAFEKVAGNDGAMTPEAAAEAACQALQSGTFFAWTHPQTTDYVQKKNENIDRWMTGMRRAQSKLLGVDFSSKL